MQEFSKREVSAFRYWIQGYPNFYEPIVEAYFRVIGYEVVRRPAQVNRQDIQRLITRLFDGTQAVGPELDRQRLVQALEKRKRLQPDLLLARNGRYYLAELKSWGGFRTGQFDTATLRAEFFKEPINGAYFLLDKIEACGPIAGKMLVVSSRSPEHDQVLTLLRQTTYTDVELHYLDEFIHLPQLAGLIEKQLRYLDAAVAELKQALRPSGEIP